MPINYAIKEYPVDKNKSGLELQNKLLILYLDPSYSNECNYDHLRFIGNSNQVDSKTFYNTLKQAAKYNRTLYEECCDQLNI